MAESVCIAEPVDLPEVVDTAKFIAPTRSAGAAKPAFLADSVGVAVESPVDTFVGAAVELPHPPVAAAVEPRPGSALNSPPSTVNDRPSPSAPPA